MSWLGPAVALAVCCTTVAAQTSVDPANPGGARPFGPTLGDTLFLRIRNHPSPNVRDLSAWNRHRDRAYRPPPERVGAVVGAAIGMTAGMIYGVHRDIQDCPWVCGLGPLMYGMRGALYGAGIGFTLGLVSRLL